MYPKMQQESCILAQNHCRSACARSAAPSTSTARRGSLRMVSYPASSLRCRSPASRSSATMMARSMIGPRRRFWLVWKRMKVTRSHSTKATDKTTSVSPQILIHVHPQGGSFLGDVFATQRKDTAMALLIAPSGSVRQVFPTQGPCFTTEELGALVEGWLGCVRLPHGRLMWINEEGKQHGLPSNPLATILAKSRLQPGDYIAAPAVVITPRGAGGEPPPA